MDGLRKKPKLPPKLLPPTVNLALAHEPIDKSDNVSAAGLGQADQSAVSLPAVATSHHWVQRHQQAIVMSLAAIIGGLVIALISWMVFINSNRSIVTITPTSPTPSATPNSTPTRKASPLTGVLVDPTLADWPIVSVIIENHPDARPQSGLGKAGVVYEALAEGGITRFQAFFQDTAASSIGPVRSLRPYFIDWAMEFNSPIAHAGGSATALDQVSSLGVKAMNALNLGSPTFNRITSRAAPHNLYTSSALLDALMQKKGFNTPPAFTPSPRQPDHPLPQATHPKISLNYSYSLFDVVYQYDAARNDYARSMAGKVHIDQSTKEAIHVKNVVVMYMPTVTLADTHVQMQTIGQGKAIVFRDGDAITGTWRKDNRSSRTQLLNDQGTPIALNAGNTWYSVMPTGKTVGY